MDASDSQATESITPKPLERSTRAKIIDGIIILIILIVAGILEFQLISVNPNEQLIPGLDDPQFINFNFAYPNIEEQIGTTGLILMIFLPWYLLLLISTVCLYYLDTEFALKNWLIHFSLMNRMLLFSFGVTLLVTDVIKLFCGSPRPYFLEIYNANDDDSDLLEAKLSFPSGHASQAMGSLFLLTTLMYKSWKYTQNMYYNQSYIIGMKIYNPHSYYLCGLWWIMREIPLIAISVIFVPIYIAIWCGLTRITDYKHFAADVVGGMTLGASVAYMTYLIFYNEMYNGFDYKLDKEIQQLNAKVENKTEASHSVPLQQ